VTAVLYHAIALSDDSMKKYPFAGIFIYAGLILTCGVIPPTFFREAQNIMSPIASLVSDHTLHGLGFGVFAWLLCFGYYSAGYRKLPLIRIITISLAYGLFIEAVQIPLPYRVFEWTDIYADGAGVLAAVILFILVIRIRYIRNRPRPKEIA